MTVGFRSFRARLLTLVLALLAGALAAALLVVSRVTTAQAEATTRRSLEVAQSVFERIITQRDKQLASSVQLLGGDFAFKQAVGTRDPDTIRWAAMNHQKRIGADLLLVTDETGKLLADSSGRRRPGSSLKRIPIVGKACGGELCTAVLFLDGVLMQAAAAPLLAPDPIGTILAGFRVDDGLARELKRMTLAEVTFLAEGRAQATTLPGGAAPALEGALGHLAPPGGFAAPPRLPGTTLLALAGERYLTLSVPIGGRAIAVLQRSWDAALAPIRALQRTILFVGLLALAAAALVGLGIAHGVAGPVRTLAAATERIVQGRFDTPILIRQRDEIGQLGAAFNHMQKGLAEREKIRDVLNKTVSPEIAEELLRHGQLRLGGEEREMTVLFSDIRGFTSISEGLSPQDLITQLNDYLTGMTEAVEKCGGVVDKYIGDAIMALFGAPIAHPDDAHRAQRAALAMLTALNEHNADRAKAGRPAWASGIGLNTGVSIAGNMGSETRLSYTVIGDAVNLSSRLEGLTKTYGVRIIVSDATRRAGEGVFVYRVLDVVRVKGKKEPVQIFELLSVGAASSPPGWVTQFEHGFSAYTSGNWKGASAAFEEVLVEHPGDGPSRLYLDRLKVLSAAPPPPNWDGVFTHTTK